MEISSTRQIVEALTQLAQIRLASLALDRPAPANELALALS